MNKGHDAPHPKLPGLNKSDRESIDRLLNASHRTVAIKIYRGVFDCSAAEAEQAIRELAAQIKASRSK